MVVMGTTVHSQQLAAHVDWFCSTTELMCFWVCLTRFTSGRSGMAVPRAKESLYFIYSTKILDFMQRKWEKIESDHLQEDRTKQQTKTHDETNNNTQKQQNNKHENTL